MNNRNEFFPYMASIYSTLNKEIPNLSCRVYSTTNAQGIILSNILRALQRRGRKKNKKTKEDEENSGRTDNTLSSSKLFFVNVGSVGDFNVNASSHTPRDVRRSTSWHTRKCPLTNAFQRRPKSPRPNASRVWIPVFDPYRTEKSKNHAAASVRRIASGLARLTTPSSSRRCWKIDRAFLSDFLIRLRTIMYNN